MLEQRSSVTAEYSASLEEQCSWYVGRLWASAQKAHQAESDRGEQTFSLKSAARRAASLAAGRGPAVRRASCQLPRYSSARAFKVSTSNFSLVSKWKLTMPTESPAALATSAKVSCAYPFFASASMVASMSWWRRTSFEALREAPKCSA